jgi:ABC-2 type transport system permease protein
MSKIFHVAVREFLATVLTKGFLIGLVIVPVVMLIAIFGMMTLFDEEAPRIEGEVAILDPTGLVYEELRDYLQPENIAERRDDFEEKVEEQLPEEVRQIADGGAMADARRRAMSAILGEVPKLAVNRLSAGADLESEKEPLRLGAAADGGRLALVVVHDDAVVP